ncbi:DUF1254 domain-containing protein [Nocardioides alcanivorans]|uniref:DUF1254 domain-containing protein n=1 Tax=Nocardioides alcanivorans TaxID=2897352 RepID=UPI001F352CE2|nr:DUF1254 domain-containing protein [Nocardioides alcanivorans]
MGSPYVAAARLRLNRTLPQTPFAPRIATSPGAALNNLGRQRRASDSRYRPGVGVSTDTLYTSAWLDLASGPFLLEVPTIRGRYYSFQFGHSDTSSDLAVGSRTHGEQLPPIVITGPGHEPVGLPEGAMLVRSRTRYLNLPGRMLVDPEDAADLACAHQIQDDIRLRPLDFWRRGDNTVVNPPPDQRSITPPEGLPPELGMLHSLGEVLRDEIVPEPDLQLVEEFARIGLTPRPASTPATSPPVIAIW